MLPTWLFVHEIVLFNSSYGLKFEDYCIDLSIRINRIIMMESQLNLIRSC